MSAAGPISPETSFPPAWGKVSVQAPAAEADPQGGAPAPACRRFISQIEGAFTSPSLSSLVSVCAWLRMEVGEFLAQSEAHRPPYPGTTNRLSMRSKPEFLSLRAHIFLIRGQRCCAASSSTTPRRTGSEPIAHEAKRCYLWASEGSVHGAEVAGERNVLEAGDSLHFQSTKIHSLLEPQGHPG